jgi:hypothetical protein
MHVYACVHSWEFDESLNSVGAKVDDGTIVGPTIYFLLQSTCIFSYKHNHITGKFGGR